jgi:hypothetical protein
MAAHSGLDSRSRSAISGFRVRSDPQLAALLYDVPLDRAEQMAAESGAYDRLPPDGWTCGDSRRDERAESCRG